MQVIIFNGRKYNSIEEMPANDRQAFEQLSSMFVDKNGNGIPDFLEGDMVQNVMTAFTRSFNYSGQNYSNLDELPPDVREKVQGAFEKLSQMGIITQDSPMSSQRTFTEVGREPARSSEPAMPREFSPTIQEEGGFSVKWVMVGLGLMLCLGLTALGIFLMLR